ncbi:hypothetical protein WN944_003747 [Citrus x changshan-huyou]|uniref:Uncharacterized protein n=1 Tax=Citrus x changshan-huyou TaxID=2935761 RepID=A0AAP0QLH8_9ROSI
MNTNYCFNPILGLNILSLMKLINYSSATLPDFVEELARSITHGAVRVIVGRNNWFLLEVKKGNFLHYVKALQRRVRFVILV